MQGEDGFGLVTSFDDVVKARVVAAMVVLIGTAVGWRQLGMMGLSGCVDDRVDVVVCCNWSGG